MTGDPFTKLRYSGEGIIRKWAEKGPENPEGWMRYGALLCASNRWEESKEILEKALGLTPTGWVLEAVLYYLGISLTYLEEYEKAEEYLKRVVEITNKPRNAWFNLGFLYENWGKPDEAIKAYKESLIADPDFIKAWGAIGRVYEENGQFDEAEATYRNILSAHPESKGALFALVKLVITRRDDLAEAESLYRKFIALDEKNSYAWHNFVTVLEAKGDYEEAKEVFRKSEELERA
jgi:protein O-GlcNAc transferase